MTDRVGWAGRQEDFVLTDFGHFGFGMSLFHTMAGVQ